MDCQVSPPSVEVSSEPAQASVLGFCTCNHMTGVRKHSSITVSPLAKVPEATC